MLRLCSFFSERLIFGYLQWHALERSEQAKYYDMARKEKELHMQLYPGWSARDNYATRTKKKKLKRDPRSDNHSGTSCDEEQSKLTSFSKTCTRAVFLYMIFRCSLTQDFQFIEKLSRVEESRPYSPYGEA